MNKNVILGAGISGLYLGKELSKSRPVVILEKRENVGGMCSSFKHKEYHFDLGPHKFFTQLPGINDEFFNIVKEDYHKIKKKNSIFILGKSYQFPIQISQLLFGLSPKFSAKFSLSFGSNTAKNIFVNKLPQNYEEYFIKGFGKVGYNLIFEGYAWKVWGDPKKLSVELAQKRVPVSSVFDLLKKMLFSKNDPAVSAEYFFYPKGGFGAICNNLSREVRENKGIINTSSEIVKIEHKEDKHILSVECVLQGKKGKIPVENLISTIRLKDFISLLSPAPPQEVIECAESLKFRSLVILYLVLDKEKVLSDNWIFFPEKDYLFNRVSEQKSFGQEMFPPGKTGIMVEVTCGKEDALFQKSDKEIYDRVILDLVKTKLISPEDIVDYFVKRIPDIYPVYSLDYKKNLQVVIDYLNGFDNCYTIGRNGLFNYNNADHCIDMSKKVANHILINGSRQQWKELLTYFDEYKIVD